MEPQPSIGRHRHLCLKSIELATRNPGYTALSENQCSFVLPLDLGIFLFFFFPAKESSPEPPTAGQCAHAMWAKAAPGSPGVTLGDFRYPNSSHPSLFCHLPSHPKPEDPPNPLRPHSPWGWLHFSQIEQHRAVHCDYFYHYTSGTSGKPMAWENDAGPHNQPAHPNLRT